MPDARRGAPDAPKGLVLYVLIGENALAHDPEAFDLSEGVKRQVPITALEQTANFKLSIKEGLNSKPQDAVSNDA
jgi:hypothetical protein